MSRYRLSRAADLDLEMILWDGLERFGPARTERYLTDLEQTFDYLSQYPEATRLRTEMVPPVRAYSQDAHVIIYEIENDGIFIVRIRSARENWIFDPIGDDL